MCEVTAIATPLDELNIQFTPPISIPERHLQHTHATFVRGLLNPVSILSIMNIIVPLKLSIKEMPNIFLLLFHQQHFSACFNRSYFLYYKF